MLFRSTREATFVIYPPEQRAEAERSGVPQPPVKYCPPPAAKPGQPGSAVVAMSLPAAGSVITSTVLIRGSARGSYVLEYGIGSDPQQWKPISSAGSSVADGILGSWDTAGLTPGAYTLRLRVITSDGVPADARVVVRVAR